MEIGAGRGVPTVRMQSENFLERWSSHARCTLVRINPDMPFADKAENNPQFVVGFRLMLMEWLRIVKGGFRLRLME